MIDFYKPTLKRKDMDSVLQTMVDEHIGPGEKTTEFTQQFAQKVGCFTSVSFRTYSDCIKQALRLLGAKENTKIAISPLAPIIYKTVIEDIGSELVLVDIDKENGMPSEQSVIASGAEILVLYESCGSVPMKYNQETTFADKNDYSAISAILEDVTESIGGYYKDEAKPGNWGKAVICNFEENSVVSCAGGASLAVKGNYSSALKEYKPTKYQKLTDLNASLGLVQLSNLEDNCIKRREIYKLYQQSLSRTANKQFGLSLIDFSSSCSTFAVLLESKPEEVIEFAAKNNIPVKITFEDSICKDYKGDLFADFPNAAAYYYRTVSFPIYPFLKNTELDIISKIIAHLP